MNERNLTVAQIEQGRLDALIERHPAPWTAMIGLDARRTPFIVDGNGANLPLWGVTGPESLAALQGIAAAMNILAYRVTP